MRSAQILLWRTLEEDVFVLCPPLQLCGRGAGLWPSALRLQLLIEEEGLATHLLDFHRFLRRINGHCCFLTSTTTKLSINQVKAIFPGTPLCVYVLDKPSRALLIASSNQKRKQHIDQKCMSMNYPLRLGKWQLFKINSINFQISWLAVAANR